MNPRIQRVIVQTLELVLILKLHGSKIHKIIMKNTIDMLLLLCVSQINFGSKDLENCPPFFLPTIMVPETPLQIPRCLWSMI